MADQPLTPDGLPVGHQLREAYETTPKDAAELVDAGEAVILDVRTEAEVEFARPACSSASFLHIPLGELEQRADEVEDFADGKRVLTMCYLGGRSFQAATILQAKGMSDARSIMGGMDSWSRAIDPSVPRYDYAGGKVTPKV